MYGLLDYSIYLYIHHTNQPLMYVGKYTIPMDSFGV